MRVLLVAGTRPEVIKLAPLHWALREDPRFHVQFCLTSQHRDMVRPLLDFFQVRPDFDLDLMRPRQSLAALTGRVLRGVERVLRGGYDWVVVHGDTTTALAAGLAAFYRRVPVAHVEAGLRSFDLGRPFPEEANRRMVDLVSALWFAPTGRARANLLAEGCPAGRVHVTGNTGIDALCWTVARVRAEGRPPPLPLSPSRPGGDRLVLVTAHRRESLGAGLRGICRAVKALVRGLPGVRVLFPIHPNPAIRDTVTAMLDGLPQVSLCAPLSYPDFVRALMHASLVLTDSGGVQEEAAFLGKRALVLRQVTERIEGLAAGAAELVGTEPRRIVERAGSLLREGGSEESARGLDIYGDGRAAERIRTVLGTGVPADLLVEKV